MRHQAVVPAILAVSLVLAAACSSNDTGTAKGDDKPDEPTAADDPRAPGVTDDAIKVGITYVDLEAVRQFVDLDQGDYEAAYQAVIDDINASGGIGGRRIEPVFAPVSPLGTAPAEEACVKLTEDEDVFAVIGFFQDDAVSCPVVDHGTAAIGGVMTKVRHDAADAPWFTTEAGEDADLDAIRAFAEAGELDGKLGVFGSILNQDEVDDSVVPLLDELGIEPTDVAILDAPMDDLAAQNQATGVIAERFRSKDIEKVLAVGSAAVPIANGLASQEYRPQLLFTSRISIEAYTGGLDPDLSMLEGAVLGSIEILTYDEPDMQACLDRLGEAGITDLEDPSTLDPGAPTPYISAATACRNLGLFAAIAEAAGEDLNYGTFGAAGESLGKLHLPGAEADYDFGPYPSLDGDQPIYLFDWDSGDEQFVRREG